MARLSESEIRETCAAAFADGSLAGKRVLLIVPDLSRSCPLDSLFRTLYELYAESTERFDTLIALGTHPPLTREQILLRVGITEGEARTTFAKARFFNHQWDSADHLVELGQLTSEEVSELSEGRFAMPVTVTCNRMVLDYDLLLVVGPVFPHEVVGFSGGNKYFFPGISGEEVLHFFHWLGAMITNHEIIGRKTTPVRAVVDRVTRMIPTERKAFCMVVQGEGLAALSFGTPEEAWSEAADESAKVHIRREPRAYHTVLSRCPEMYTDIWTAGKCMYKLEPVIADGGRLIIYAPHITEVSEVHGEHLSRVGYHVRDYFCKQWTRFENEPWGILAHSTHVKGAGTYENGVETPRVEVVLATRIPERVCRDINLGYMDPDSVVIGDYENREDEGVLYVPKAGEILYRLAEDA